MATDPLAAPANIIDIMYPVGCIYMTTSTDSPQSMLSRFGVTSTWERIQGRFILGSSPTYFTTGNQGGAGLGGEETHLLTVDELPAHTHTYREAYVTGSDGDWGSGGLPNEIRTSNTSSVGGNVAHNNMPPYYVANIWRRTS